MSIKKSIMLSDQAVAAIEARSKEIGETAKSDIPKIKWIIQQSLPKLNEEEWQLIINVYAGSLMQRQK